MLAAYVKDQDGNDPPDNMEANFTVGFSTVDACVLPYTRIFDIQGIGLTAAITGIVTTQGVVVGDYEGPSPAVAWFLHPGSEWRWRSCHLGWHLCLQRQQNNIVSLGDVVRVTGKGG